MKIRTTAGQLADIVGRVARAAAARTTVPVLQGILMRAEAGPEGAATAGSLTMSATDTEISLTLTAAAPVEQAGRAVVPARLLLQYAKSLPASEEVTVEADDAKGEATIASAKSRIALRCLPAKDFPALPAFPKDGAFSVDSEALLKAIPTVLPFASKDESRPVLTGVLVEFGEGSLRMVATDSYRLAVSEGPLAGASGEAGSAILPARALREASRLAGLGADKVEVAVSENAAGFSVGEGALVLTTRLIAGSFPEYKRLLPDAFAHDFGADRDEVAGALSRARLLGTQTPPAPVRLAFSRKGETLGEGELTISLSNQATGAATEVAQARVPEGTDFEACFNPEYLADAVAHVPSAALEFRFNDPLRPAVLRARPSEGVTPEGAAPAGNGAASGAARSNYYLIMPMRDPSGSKG